MFIAPAVADEAVYVGSCSGVFYAFEAETGTVLWQYDTATNGTAAQFHGDVLVTDDLVIVGSDARPVGHIYAFERKDGAARWKRTFPLGVAVDLKRFGDTVLVAAMNGEVAAFDLDTGDARWRVENAFALASGAFPFDPLLADGRYYVPWNAGHLDAYDVVTGDLIWRLELASPPNSSAVAIGVDLVVGTLEGGMVRVHRADGTIVSELSIGGMIYGELVATENCVLALVASPQGLSASDHALSCVVPDLSHELWRHTTNIVGGFGTFEPLVVGDQVIVGVRDQLAAVALSDGSLRWERPMRGLPRGLGSSSSALFVGMQNGDLLALPWEPKSQEGE